MSGTEISFNHLVKVLKTARENLKPLKIALLSDFASQHLAKAIKAHGILSGFDLEIWEADYDAVDQTIIDSNSFLYQNDLNYVIVLHSGFKLYKSFSGQTARDQFAENFVENLKQKIALLNSKTSAQIIIANSPEFDDRVFGNYANNTRLSFLYQIRKLNMLLMDMAASLKNISILDAQQLQIASGKNLTFDQKLFITSDIIYNLDFLALLAEQSLKIISARQGFIKKCIILDLDNTLWGGIIGDDGVEKIEIGTDLGIGKAYYFFQLWLKNLKDRGIILAVCSKNTEEIAKEPFINHPGMALHLDDISVFVANWETKVDNILFIQSVLNIGFDSIVFLDDNPFERNIVQQHIPDITVPDLPEDPAEYLSYLQHLNLFETASFTEADSVRTKQYQEEAERTVFQKKFLSEKEYLQSLNMVAQIKPIDNFTLPRVAQLTQRSNQFNLRTRRYSETDILEMLKNENIYMLTVSLKDVFGDYGLISAVILEKKADQIFIDTWIMSCRVLKRGVEQLVLNEIVNVAQARNCSTISGEYLPTAKNGIVKDHYLQLGFIKNEHIFKMDVAGYSEKEHFITKQPD